MPGQRCWCKTYDKMWCGQKAANSHACEPIEFVPGTQVQKDVRLISIQAAQQSFIARGANPMASGMALLQPTLPASIMAPPPQQVIVGIAMQQSPQATPAPLLQPPRPQSTNGATQQHLAQRVTGAPQAQQLPIIRNDITTQPPVAKRSLTPQASTLSAVSHTAGPCRPSIHSGIQAQHVLALLTHASQRIEAGRAASQRVRQFQFATSFRQPVQFSSAQPQAATQRYSDVRPNLRTSSLARIEKSIIPPTPGPVDSLASYGSQDPAPEVSEPTRFGTGQSGANVSGATPPAHVDFANVMSDIDGSGSEVREDDAFDHDNSNTGNDNSLFDLAGSKSRATREPTPGFGGLESELLTSANFSYRLFTMGWFDEVQDECPHSGTGLLDGRRTKRRRLNDEPSDAKATHVSNADIKAYLDDDLISRMPAPFL